MVVSVSGSQQRLLDKGTLEPTYLVDIRSTTGRLSFSTDRAIEYNGSLYQPYLSTVGTIRTSANFPDNSTTGKEFQLQFENAPIELDGTAYPHVSQTFDVFNWELADVDVKVLLTPSGVVTEDVAIPLVSSGVAGTPSEIDPQKFILPVATRNIKLNDSLPVRAIIQGEFPEADRDALDGKTYLPILVGSGIRVVAQPIVAGATTTVTEQVEAGTTLKVSETTGFIAGDDIIIGSFVANPFGINSVDEDNRELTLDTDLATLNTIINVGTVVREDRASYDYSIANHECGTLSEVFVTKRNTKDPVAISGSLFTKLTVDDPGAIGGKRTDVRINELISFGQGGVTQQPEHSVPGGNHDHNVSASQETTQLHYAGATSPGGASAANDGNEDTFFQLDTSGTTQVTYTTHANIPGVFVAQRYRAVVTNAVITSGDWRIRRGTTSFLTVSVAHGKGEFRSASDTGGDETSDWNVLNNEGGAGQTMDLFEGWKEVTMSPAVSEDMVDLSDTDRDLDVKVSAANIEVGDRVEVVIDGPLIPDDSGRFGPVTASGLPIERPDAVYRWILEEALAQPGILSEDSYAEAATEFESRGIKLRFAVTQPMKLDQLFDLIANNSQALHFWGRDGHVVKFLEDDSELTEPVATLTEDVAGVITLDVRNTASAADLRNELTAYFDRDWTQTQVRDESYRGSVLGNDFESQAIYGKRTGDIDGASGRNALYFDMLTTASGAQSTVDKIVGNWSTPKKHLTAATDWTHLNLEPGDLIQLNSPLFLNDIRARVLEHSIDNRLFCQIVARQIGDSIAEHYTSVQSGLLRADPDFDHLWGVEDEWTFLIRFRALGAWPTLFDTSIFQGIKFNPFSNNSKVDIFWDANHTPNPTFVVNLFSTNGSSQKRWEWDNLFLGSDFVGPWKTLIVSWNGNDTDEIKLWCGNDGSRASNIPETTRQVNNTIAMADPGRSYRYIVNFTNDLHRTWQAALWNKELTQDEIDFLDANTHHDFNQEEGAYTSSANLKRWHRLSLDRGDIGRDYAAFPTSSGIDVNANTTPVGQSAIRIDAPR